MGSAKNRRWKIEIPELEKKFEELQEKDKRMAAEYAYVLAVRHRRDNNSEKSHYYANECLRILEELNLQRLEDMGFSLNAEDGIAGYFCEGVARARFEEMGII